MSSVTSVAGLPSTLGESSQVQAGPKSPVLQPGHRESAPERPAEGSQFNTHLLAELQTKIERVHGIGLEFSVHQKTGRTIVRVVDRETQELLREIPSEELLDLAARVDEVKGILFDREG